MQIPLLTQGMPENVFVQILQANTWCPHDQVMKTFTFRITGPLWGDPSVNGGFTPQSTKNMEFDVFASLNKLLIKRRF